MKRFKLGHIGSNGIKWDETGWKGIIWDPMGSSGIKRDEMGWYGMNEIKWDQMRWNGIKSDEIGSYWISLDCIGSKWIKLDPIWIKLDYMKRPTKLDQTGLDRWKDLPEHIHLHRHNLYPNRLVCNLHHICTGMPPSCFHILHWNKYRYFQKQGYIK